MISTTTSATINLRVGLSDAPSPPPPNPSTVRYLSASIWPWHCALK